MNILCNQSDCIFNGVKENERGKRLCYNKNLVIDKKICKSYKNSKDKINEIKNRANEIKNREEVLKNMLYNSCSYTDIMKIFGFKFSTKENFPLEECINKNKNNIDIYDGENKYFGLIFCPFNNSISIDLLRPYIWKNEESNKSYFGWVSIYSEKNKVDPNYIDNFYESIHAHDELSDFVFAFVKYNLNNEKEDNNLIEKLKNELYF